MRDQFRRNASRRDRRLAHDVRRELEHHLAASTDYLMDQGLPAEAAHAEATRRLGALQKAEAQLIPYARDRERTMRFRDWMHSVMQDVRYAVRSLRRQPAMTALIVGTLALGIGVNAAMFGILDRLLLSGPVHVDESNDIVRIFSTRTRDDAPPLTYARSNYATYTALQMAGSFQSLAAYYTATEMIGDGRDVEEAEVQQSTWTLFPLLGVEPELGRFFGASEDTPPAGLKVAVLSYGLWQRRYGGDPAVLGQSVTIDDSPFTVIGVAPRGFTGPDLSRIDLWVPVSAGLYAPRPDWPTTWGALWLKLLARMAPGTTASRADAEITGLHRSAYGGPASVGAELTLSVRPLSFDDEGAEAMEASVSRWLLGVASIVLLIACANVANLLLARGIRRRRELVLRAALGISRARLLRLLAVEVVLLVAAGALSALLLAHWAGGLVESVLLPDIAWTGLADAGRILLFTAAIACLALLLILPVPALQGLRLQMTESLKDGGPQQSGRRRAAMRYGLTMAQAALSVVLLVGAGLFVESLIRVQGIDLGIDADRVMTVSLNWPPTPDGLSDEERRAESVRRRTVTSEAVARLGAVPGIEAASASIGLPFWSAFGVDVRVPGLDTLPELAGGGPYVAAVRHNYFDTVGTQIVSGRSFAPDEGRGTAAVTIVNQTMADALWPNGNALEQCLYIGDSDPPCSAVVGVSANTRRFQLREEPAMQYYVPLGQERGIAGVELLARTGEGAAAVTDDVERAMLALDPTLQHVRLRPLRESLDPQVRPWRLGATLFTAFGALAFFIAALGLYSVVAYVTAQRTQEFGIRLALGAQRRDLLTLVATGGLMVGAVGIGLGVLLALAIAPELEPMLFETPTRSPLVFGVVVSLLLAVALAASLIPARRATRVDPIIALRP